MSTTEIDALLESQIITSSVEVLFPGGRLPPTHAFAWQNIAARPKADHGLCDIRGNWYKTMQYGVLHTGGFLRLWTMRGRAYWNCQNEQGHTTPDWKIHFSCELADVPAAWDILAALFMEMKCEIGMKATYLGMGDWSERQRGRELTVYVYYHDSLYKDYMQGVVPDQDHEFYLGPEFDILYLRPSFWFTFIREAEKRLANAAIRSRGVADGDLALPGCRYASLRNEAYVLEPTNPPLPLASSLDASLASGASAVHLSSVHTYTSSADSEAKSGALIESAAAAACVPHHQPEQGGSPSASTPLSSSSSPGCDTSTPGGADTKRDNSSVSRLSAEEAPMKLEYPPNYRGWNAAGHVNPLLEVIFFLRAVAQERVVVYG